MEILKPHKYQSDAVDYLYTHPYTGLFADPGVGKTLILLLLADRLKRDGMLGRVLLISTTNIVATTWPLEIEKWGLDLTYTLLTGYKRERKLSEDTDIHLLVFNSIPWLDKQKLWSNYDTLFLDESTYCKNWSALRVKILRKRIAGFHRRHIATGTPIPESMVDLFSQQYIVDKGECFGKSITRFRNEHFIDIGRDRWSKYVPRAGHADIITQTIAPYSYRIPLSVVSQLPERLVNDIMVDIPKSVKQQARELARHLCLEANKLPQRSAAGDMQANRRIANGILQDGTVLHTSKIDALETIIEQLQGSPVIVFCCFRAEVYYLSERFRAPYIMGRVVNVMEIITRWNKGNIPVLLLLPAAVSHGLNLQYGGHHIVWFSLPTSGDQYNQSVKRVWRQGVKQDVIEHKIIARNSIDQPLIRLLSNKTTAQQDFLDALMELQNGG